MACCVDVDEGIEEKRNGAFPISNIKRCFEGGRY